MIKMTMRFFSGLILAALLGSTVLAAEVRRTLVLTGLTCAACSAAVTKALKQVEGVRNVTVNDERTQAVVVADESVPLAALTQAVEKAGYQATVVEGADSKKSEGDAKQESANDAPSGVATFEDVDGIEALRHRFIKDAGSTRVILLLSPT